MPDIRLQLQLLLQQHQHLHQHWLLSMSFLLQPQLLLLLALMLLPLLLPDIRLQLQLLKLMNEVLIISANSKNKQSKTNAIIVLQALAPKMYPLTRSIHHDNRLKNIYLTQGVTQTNTKTADISAQAAAALSATVLGAFQNWANA
jgi:hypothetical protein